MFHWICPECGREIPPKLKECPSCDPQPAPVVNVSAAVVSVAKEAIAHVPNAAAHVPQPILQPILKEIVTPVESAVAPAATEAEPPPVPATIDTLKTNEPAVTAGHLEPSAMDPATTQRQLVVVGQSEPVATPPAGVAGNAAGAQDPAAEVPPDQVGDPLLALAEQIRDAQSQPTLASTDGPHLREPGEPGEPAHVPETGHAQASTEPDDISPDDVVHEIALDVAPEIAAAAPELPLTPAEPAPATVTAAVTVTSAPISQVSPEDVITEEIVLPGSARAQLDQLAAAIGVSEPQSTAPEPGSRGSGSPRSIAPASSGSRESVTEPVTPVESIAHAESEYAHAGQLALLTGAGPLALLAPPEAAPAAMDCARVPSQPEPVESNPPGPSQLAITGLASTEEPRAGKPPSGSWLQLAPLQNYRAATRAMQPASFAPKILTPDSGPRMTLPGPTLPPELARLQNANLVTVIGDSSRSAKSRVPGWAVSFLVMLALLVIGVGVVSYFLPVARSNAETPPATEEANVIPSRPPAAPPSPSQPASHPLAQYIEVTGFRIVVDFNKKSEIHYLIVNHSGAELSDVTVYVTLRSASAKPGQPPLSRFSFRAPSLGPFESKEMTSSIEKLSRSMTLPDWQDLRPEIQISQ